VPPTQPAEDKKGAPLLISTHVNAELQLGSVVLRWNSPHDAVTITPTDAVRLADVIMEMAHGAIAHTAIVKMLMANDFPPAEAVQHSATFLREVKMQHVIAAKLAREHAQTPSETPGGDGGAPNKNH
jgi:hypothetical protein